MGKTQLIGAEAERLASTFLQSQGLKLVSCNFRCKLGEIDLIMQDKNNLVFIEVRCRNNEAYGTGLESITRSKQLKLIRAAEYYLQTQTSSNQPYCRFDVIAITDSKAANPKIQWIKDAFVA